MFPSRTSRADDNVCRAASLFPDYERLHMRMLKLADDETRRTEVGGEKTRRLLVFSFLPLFSVLLLQRQDFQPLPLPLALLLPLTSHLITLRLALWFFGFAVASLATGSLASSPPFSLPS
mmetsp:Transcript_39756/g.124895  ORF Transcript_39756/g.124895 Transcript_39756/m.124895 type:complete len:120 (-) Transcript_39756:339-698(-)